MFEYRQVLARMRLGDTDRAIARTGLMGRRKLAQLRRTAEAAGWLDAATPVPGDSELAVHLTPGRAQPAVASLAEPHRERIERWWRQGIQSTTIHGALVRNHGFTGSYSSVRRFLAGLEAAHPQVTTVLEFDPGEAAQVDFGKGPEVLDRRTGELLSSWKGRGWDEPSAGGTDRSSFGLGEGVAELEGLRKRASGLGPVLDADGLDLSAGRADRAAPPVGGGIGLIAQQMVRSDEFVPSGVERRPRLELRRHPDLRTSRGVFSPAWWAGVARAGHGDALSHLYTCQDGPEWGRGKSVSYGLRNRGGSNGTAYRHLRAGLDGGPPEFRATKNDVSEEAAFLVQPELIG